MKHPAFTYFVIITLMLSLSFASCEKEENNTIVTLIDNQELESGVHEVEWDQTNENGKQVNIGTYKAILDVKLSSDKEFVFEIMPGGKSNILKSTSDDPDGNDDDPTLYSIEADKEEYETGEIVLLTFNVVNPQEVSVYIEEGE
ncbi:MAG: hypothetical protein K9I94_03880 [Bacteroidales bacterium]|nr:hypothetical protein [Bacteroidales bacterium]